MSLSRSLTANSAVRVPKNHGIRVCKNYVVKMPKTSSTTTSKRTKSLVDAFTSEVVSTLIKKCMPAGSPMPKRKIGQGGFGKVFEMDDNRSVVKVQVFSVSRKLDDQTSEVFLGKLFGMNGIGPKVLGAGFAFTDAKDKAVSFIMMQKGTSLTSVLRGSNANQKAEIMRIIKPQYMKALNRMLTLGFACVDLKPSNTLYNVAERKLQLIDFSENFCPQTPMIIDKMARGSRTRGEIVSQIPRALRRDIIAAQLVMFHVTTKLFTKSEFGRDLIDRILTNSTVLNNCHKICCLGEVPDDYVHLSEDRSFNNMITGFLEKFSRILSHNFRHYSSMEKIGTTLETFVDLLRLRV